MEKIQTIEPLVSICIPVFNGEKTIRKTIGSIVNQTYKNIEIIIVDNCSTDSTVKIVREFKDPRLRLIQNKIHLPHAEDNWNRCFQYVHGEFMAIFHADDVYLPQMVLRQIETFRQYPLLGGVFTQGNWIDENDEIIGAFQLPNQITGQTPYSYQEILTAVLEFGDFLPCPSAMLRTNLYKKLAPFRYDRFFSASDLDMWLRAAKCAPILILNETLMNYRFSKTQGTYVINQLRTQEADYFKVCDYHISLNEANGNPNNITIRTLRKYNLLNLDDQLMCALNCLIKQDFNEFIENFQQIPFKRCLITVFKNPYLLHPVYSGRIYQHFFQIFRLFLSCSGGLFVTLWHKKRGRRIFPGER